MFRRLFHLSALLLLLLSSAMAQTSAEVSSAIRYVTFENVVALSGENQQQIIDLLRQEDPGWIMQQNPPALALFVERLVMSEYQDLGYWRAKVSAKVIPVKKTGEEQVDIVIVANHEGQPFWLKEIRWTGVNGFPLPQVMALMPMHAGNRMSRTKVEQGLEAIRQLYASSGYIAFAAIPRAELNDTEHSILLQITVQEDKPFHFGNLSVEGMDRSSGREIRQAWAPLREKVYSQEKLRRFFKKFLRPLPAETDPLEYVSRNLDFDTHKVDIVVRWLPATEAER